MYSLIHKETFIENQEDMFSQYYVQVHCHYIVHTLLSVIGIENFIYLFSSLNIQHHDLKPFGDGNIIACDFRTECIINMRVEPGKDFFGIV